MYTRNFEELQKLLRNFNLIHSLKNEARVESSGNHLNLKFQSTNFFKNQEDFTLHKYENQYGCPINTPINQKIARDNYNFFQIKPLNIISGSKKVTIYVLRLRILRVFTNENTKLKNRELSKPLRMYFSISFSNEIKCDKLHKTRLRPSTAQF